MSLDPSSISISIRLGPVGESYVKAQRDPRRRKAAEGAARFREGPVLRRGSQVGVPLRAVEQCRVSPRQGTTPLDITSQQQLRKSNGGPGHRRRSLFAHRQFPAAAGDWTPGYSGAYTAAADHMPNELRYEASMDEFAAQAAPHCSRGFDSEVPRRQLRRSRPHARWASMCSQYGRVCCTGSSPLQQEIICRVLRRLHRRTRPHARWASACSQYGRVEGLRWEPGGGATWT